MYFHLFASLERPEIICYIVTVMKVICIEEQAFFALMGEVIQYVKSQIAPSVADKWIGKKETTRLLRIKSSTTLQKLRDGGQIRYSQPERKHIVYDRDSIIEYLEAHTKEPF